MSASVLRRAAPASPDRLSRPIQPREESAHGQDDPLDSYGHLALSVEHVDAEHERLSDAGLSPRKLIDFAPAGEVIARFFFIQDPDGNEIEVLQRGGRYL